MVDGVLNTDRPHAIEVQGVYRFNFGTNVGVNTSWRSGTPVSTDVMYNGVNFFPNGRNDMGRTPSLTQTDLFISHPFKIGGFELEASINVINLFDEDTVTRINNNKYDEEICDYGPGCDTTNEWYFNSLVPYDLDTVMADAAPRSDLRQAAGLAGSARRPSRPQVLLLNAARTRTYLGGAQAPPISFLGRPGSRAVPSCMPRPVPPAALPRRRDVPPGKDRRARPRWLRELLLPAGVLLLLAFAAHAPALRGGFVWDDDVYVTANPYLEDHAGLQSIWLRPGTILQAYPGRGIDALIPLTFTTLWLEHRLWGAEPVGYHAVNIAFHALAAALLWVLLRRLGVPGAWLAAALFAVHPVTVESVAWVAELKNLQSGVLALLCLLAWHRFDAAADGEAAPRGRRRFLVLALLLFAAALLSKPAVVGVPIVVALLIWWKRGRLRSADLGILVPLATMSAAAVVLTLGAETPVDPATGGAWQASLVERTLIAGRSLWFYVGTLLWPTKLAAIYPRWEVDTGAWWQYAYPLAAAAAFAALWLLRGRLGRGPLAAALSYAVLVGPTLGFVAVNYHLYSFVADHFQYHAAPALLALLAAGLAKLHGRLGRGAAARGLLAAGAAMVLALGVETWRHAQAFRSEEARCLATIARNPGAWLALNNLGVALAARGKPDEAITRYREALRIRPGYAEAHNNLGVALDTLGRVPEAIAEYRAALAIWPSYAAAHNNLGAALASTGRVDDAIVHYREALRARPGYADAHKNLGTALAGRGRAAEAVQQYLEALKARPDWAEAHNDIGLTLASIDRLEEAIVHYRRALALKRDNAECRVNLGNALAAAGRTAEAIEQHREALRLEPGSAAARSSLGRSLAAAGRPEEALGHYRDAVRLAPGSAAMNNDLGAALAAAGDLAGAIAALREAVRLDPDYADGHLNLATALTTAGQLEEAMQHCREALRLRPDSAAAHNALGVCLARRGRLADAIAEFEAALRADPADASAAGNLERARGMQRGGAR